MLLSSCAAASLLANCHVPPISRYVVATTTTRVLIIWEAMNMELINDVQSGGANLFP
jgi:hypothetical protein